jgi:hypothetical protein
METIQIPLFLLLDSQHQWQTNQQYLSFSTSLTTRCLLSRKILNLFKQSLIESGELDDNQDEDNNDNVNS